MTNEQEFTRISSNAFQWVAIGILLGFIGGYIARPHLQPQTSAVPEFVESMTFATENSKSFPYTFQNRREAVEWLSRHISFLDRHVASSAPSRPEVEQMKTQLSQIQAKPLTQLPLPLFYAVNSEVEKLQESLSTTLVIPPQAQPTLPPNYRPTRTPRIDD